MARLVLDTRANGLVGELSERCRLSGTPLVVAIAEDIQLEKRVLGARWDIVRDKACGAFSLTEMCVPSESFAAAKVLLEARQAARAQKNWAGADAIRNGITALGLVVEDTATGARLRAKE